MGFKQNIFSLFKKFTSKIAGKGFGKLPFAVLIYQFFYRLLIPRGIVEVKSEGNTFFINSNDTGLAPHLLMHGEFAPGELHTLGKLLKPGMTFVDVGANIGYFSLMAAKAVGSSGKVYAFEPENENYNLLQKNIDENNYINVTPIKKAVSDIVGTTKFYLRDDNLCAHSIVPREGDHVVEVETTTLDEYLKGVQVDVVKIDVEGAEPKVLKGMQELIRANKSMAIVIEFYPKAIDEFGYPPIQLLNDLKNADFTLYRIGEKSNEMPVKIEPKEFAALAEGEDIPKLINILCLKDD